MICNTIGLTADSYQSIYVTGGAEIAEIYGGLNYSDLIYLKTQTITGNAPLVYGSYPGGLTDYTILGNSYQDGVPDPDNPVEVVSVGDLVTSGEHAGEYVIPVTVRGNNIWSFLPNTTNAGVTLSSENGIVRFSGIATSSINVELYGIVLEAGQYTMKANANRIPIDNNNPAIQVYRASTPTVYGVVQNNNAITGATTFTVQQNASVTLRIRLQKDVDYSGFEIKPALNYGDVILPYQPYFSETNNIYLSEPLRKQLNGDAADELSYATQTLTRRVDANCDPMQTPTTETITLPTIQTINGQNTLSIDTTLQPSTVSITGRIKPVTS